VHVNEKFSSVMCLPQLLVIKKIIDHLPDQHGSTSKDEEEYIIIYPVLVV